MRWSFVFGLGLVGLGGLGCGKGDIGDGGAGGGGAAARSASNASSNATSGSTSTGSDATTTSSSAGSGGEFADVDETDADTTIELPAVGSISAHVLSPTVIEVTQIVTKGPDPAPVSAWDFASAAPPVDALAVSADGAPVAIAQIGFKRRVLSAPLRPVDLRVAASLELVLASPLEDGAHVTIANGSQSIFASSEPVTIDVAPTRPSPAIHVNQTGYGATLPKHARVGYFLGSLGELAKPDATTFKLVSTLDGSTAFEGSLTPRPESPNGWKLSPYENLVDADFSSFTTPGNYRVVVPGLGASHAFWIGDGAPAAFARAYALGIYTQRCGMETALPFTRFTHAACHKDLAQIPTDAPEFDTANQIMNSNSGIGGVDASLYPFVKSGTIDVSGGHHDAGDYSKYTINSAHLIHVLVFAADDVPGAGDLDNLGIPESGDKKSDLLEEAKWEADFLSKMQDSDGGFFTLVYPKDRAYEADVTPDHGDPQIVWPKTTSVTAAASAALAQIGSSPRFRQEFGADVGDAYIAQAKSGWQFVQNAIAAHGFNGAYQMFYAYGDQFHHSDEIAWAATELYLATGDSTYQSTLQQVFPDPSDSSTFVWSWVRMSESYGNAIRSYAFGAKSGRVDASQLDPDYLSKCEDQIRLAAGDQVQWATDDAYGTSFPEPTKAYDTAGWYFSSTQAFDVAVAYALDHDDSLVPTLVSNLDYEGGLNPGNVSYVGGLGWRRPLAIVSQQGLNDRQLLPPSGIISGNVEGGFASLDGYGTNLNALSVPGDSAPFYDRWGDSWNVTTESVTVNEAKALVTATALMAAQSSSIAKQPWSSAEATISGLSGVASNVKKKLTLSVVGMNLAGARVVWETSDGDALFTRAFEFTPKTDHGWVEAEAQWPDGRRAFATATF